MDSISAPLIELFLVFGSIIAFGFWELYSLRRDKKRRRQAEDACNDPDRDDAV